MSWNPDTTPAPPDPGPRTRRPILRVVLAVALGGSLLAGVVGAANVDRSDDLPAECWTSHRWLWGAKIQYRRNCELPRIDCDRIGRVWYCSSRVIGRAAPRGATVAEYGSSAIGSGSSTRTTATTTTTAAPRTSTTTTVAPTTTVTPSTTTALTTTSTAPTTTVAPTTTSTTTTAPRATSTTTTSTTTTVAPTTTTSTTTTVPATTTTTTSTTTTTVAPTTTTTAPTTTTTTTVAPTTTVVVPSGCGGNASGTIDLTTDLVSLHYDHAPDRDDGHATVAGREIATSVGFTPWVVGGAYGVGNASTYRSASERVMDATWGSDGWNDAHADWAGVVQATADRWEQVLATCGDVWVAEGGQSDLTADVVRELLDRRPGLDTVARIHVVQHSFWNEGQSDPVDLAFVKANTDYEKIDDGNGPNDTAALNRTPGTQFFIDSALAGRHSSAWEAAFDYYNPNGRVDFSDTVELLEIVGMGTDRVADIDDFADVFIRN